MIEYVRITKGYYRGKVGYISEYHDKNAAVIFATVADNHCRGVLLPGRSYVDVSRKEYFKAKLHGTL